MCHRSRSERRGWRIVYALAAGVCVPPLAQGLTFNLSYDSTVTSLSYASSVETATNYAAQQLENLFTNSITININVQVDNSAFGGSGAGLGGIYSFSGIRNDLTAKATTAVDTSSVTMLNALPDPTQGGNFWIPAAEMKALGLSDPNGTGNDGTFVFGTNNPWNFSTTNRAVSGDYDFVGVALHELTECMGRTSVLGNDLNGSPGWIPFDLFRFTQPGYESTNQVDSGVYFSVDKGTTNLKNYNNPSNGGDLQDWDSITTDAADAASVQGTENDFSPADIATLDAIGYTPVTAPRTLVWDGTNNGLDTTHWLNGSNYVPTYIGAKLSVASGTMAYEPPDAASNLIFSSRSVYGTSLNITGGTVRTNPNTYVSGLGSGPGAGLYLDTGSSLNISGSGNLDIAGALVIAGDPGSDVTVTISGGRLSVGEDFSSNVDQTLYVGYSGTGTLNQSGNSTVFAEGNLQIGPMGTYGISSGSLLVQGETVNNGELVQTGGTVALAAVTGAGYIAIGNFSGSSVRLVAVSIAQDTLVINNTGQLRVLSSGNIKETLDSLTINGIGILDLNTNELDINYSAGGGDPVTTIRGYLIGTSTNRENHEEGIAEFGHYLISF